MNESWITNEIASAYEGNFRLLENARKEYTQAVYEFMVELRRELGLALHANNGEREAICTTSGFGFETAISVGLSVRSGSAEQSVASGLQIDIKAAAVSGGRPGHLRIAAAACLDEKQTGVTVDKLRAELRDYDPPAGSKTASPDAREILAIELPLEGDGLARATTAVSELIRLLAPLATGIVEYHQFTKKIRSILIECDDLLRKDLPGAGGEMQGNNGVTGWWKGMHFIQYNQPELPSFWVGYRVADQSILYGHFKANGLMPTLADAFHNYVRARPPRELEGHPSGLLLTKEELRSMPPEEIGMQVVDTFRKFYELTRCLIRDDQALSCQATQ